MCALRTHLEAGGNSSCSDPVACWWDLESEDPTLKPGASPLLCDLWKSPCPSESCFLKMSSSLFSSISHNLFPDSVSQDKPCHETEAFLLPLFNESMHPTMAASSPDELGLMWLLIKLWLNAVAVDGVFFNSIMVIHGETANNIALFLIGPC